MSYRRQRTHYMTRSLVALLLARMLLLFQLERVAPYRREPLRPLGLTPAEYTVAGAHALPIRTPRSWLRGTFPEEYPTTRPKAKRAGARFRALHTELQACGVGNASSAC